MLSSLIYAFSMYSRIPMPRIRCDGREKRFVMACFPLVGLLTGVLGYGLILLCRKAGISAILQTALFLALPLLITGGIHLDGFMDTSDAVSSFADREKRLQILSDPHIGAFAVIYALGLCGVWGASVHEILDQGSGPVLICLCLSFMLSRIISAFSVLLLPSAREGSVDAIKKGSAVLPSVILLSALLILCSVFLFILYPPGGIIMICISGLLLLCYCPSALKIFGGITGDTSGWLLCMLECLQALGLALICHFF